MLKLTVSTTWTYIEGLMSGSAAMRTIDHITSYKAPHRYFSPKFRQGFWDGVVRFRERYKGGYRVPAGFTERITVALDVVGIGYEIEDYREWDVPDPVYKLQDGKDLTLPKWQHQQQSLDMMLAHGRGIVKSPTGSGKGTLAAALIASYDLPTLYLTDRLSLLYQAKSVLEKGLGYEVGVIGDQILDPKKVTVATVQSIQSRQDQLGDLFENTQLLLLDEVHHLASDSKGNWWSKTLRQFEAPYRFGLSATPATGGPGLQLVGLVGEVIVEISLEELIQAGCLVEPKAWLLESQIAPLYAKSPWKTAYKWGVTENTLRHEMVADCVRQLAQEEIPTVTLTRQVGHGKHQDFIIASKGVRTQFISGSTSVAERNEALRLLEKKELQHITATVQVMGEGVDCPAIGAIIDATGLRGGGSSKSSKEDEVGRVTIQALGRALRAYPGKTHADIIQICDKGNRHLEAATQERIQALTDEIGERRIKPWHQRP